MTSKCAGGAADKGVQIKRNVDFQKIVRNFIFDGDFAEADPCGFGHINDTYAVYFKKPDGRMHRYILQRINHNIFKSPEKLMENISGVTGFLREKIIRAGGDPERETLNIIPAKAGKPYYKDPDGNYWRGYIFIEKAQTYQIVENATHLYNAGKAFGRFQRLLSDYPAEALHETIPDFHNTRKRFDAFVKAVEDDAAGRACAVADEIRFVEMRFDDTSRLSDLLAAGGLPLRVTHNDTKFNNVMIDDSSGEGICVIDLDTVMPGLSLYDFGDSIRSGSNPAAEDEKDLSAVCLDIGLFEKYTEGFLEAAEGFLTPTELEHLPFGAKIMTFENGMRFLTDYLNGDKYFKVHREGHNLDRARTQFKMVSDMEAKMEEMRKVVLKYCGG